MCICDVASLTTRCFKTKGGRQKAGDLGRRELLWSHGTAGVVRDVSCTRFAKGGPATILVSSADTYLYQLDPAGRQLRKDQMIGLYFNVDHGERPWGLYCTRGVDANADGAAVTRLAAVSVGSRAVLVAGLADGRLVAIAGE